MFTRFFRFIGRVCWGLGNANGQRTVGAMDQNHSDGQPTFEPAPKLQDTTAVESKTVALTGRWTGHYFYHDQGRQITAALVHEEKRITGSMRDAETDFEEPLFDMAAKIGFPPGADEQIEAHLRGLLPQGVNEPVRCVSRLPSLSVLQGEFQGGKILFIKTYQGEVFSGFKVGDHLLGQKKDRHAVRYEGKLSSDGMTIEGQWYIPAHPEGAAPRAHGRFVLRRG